MQPCFFALSGVLARDEAIAAIKAAVEKAFSKRGEEVVARNFAAIDGALAGCGEVEVPAEATARGHRGRPCPTTRPTLSPGSPPALDGRQGRPAAGQRPARRRHVPDRAPRGSRSASIAQEIPIWDPVDLHRLRQVRHRLPARRDPHEGVRARSAGGRPGRICRPWTTTPKDLPGLEDDDPGRARRLHRLRRLRRRVPGPSPRPRSSTRRST